MGRKSYRSGGTPPPEEKPSTPSAPRYTPRAARPTPSKVERIDESSYTHVRRDLVRIGILALSLFSLLILLRVVTMALGLLP